MKPKIGQVLLFSIVFLVFSWACNLAKLLPESVSVPLEKISIPFLPTSPSSSFSSSSPSTSSKNLDFSKIALTAKDLPSGFVNTVEKEKITPAKLSMFKLPNFGFEYDASLKQFSLFAANDKSPTFGIITLAYDLSSPENIRNAMKTLKAMDAKTYIKTPFLGDSPKPAKENEVKPIPAFSGFGDYSKAFSFEQEGLDRYPQVGFVMYKNLILVIITSTPGLSEPTMEIAQIAKIMDAKVKAALK